ncbi:BadF/BadG/BcrA/BcrD ATPase family protein [Nanoarchaeota archaeon]
MSLDEKVKKEGKYYVGLDVGSDSVHAIVLDKDGKVVFNPKSLMHFGNPVDTVKEAYEIIIEEVGKENIAATAFTGSVGETIARNTSTSFYYDTISIPAGVEVIAPEAEYIIHIGSKDPYFFERERLKTQQISSEADMPSSFVSDSQTGTKCGGGSGILINKQVRRFFGKEHPINIEVSASEENRQETQKENRDRLQAQVEKIHETALNAITSSEKDIDVGGRCGVVIHSDMIHLQNSGEGIPDILRGMYERIVSNYVTDVIRTRKLDGTKNAIVSGGVFLNNYVFDSIERQLDINIKRPDNFEKIGAAGAALNALRENIQTKLNFDSLENVIEAQKAEIRFADPISSALHRVHDYSDEPILEETENGLIIYKTLDASQKKSVVIGMDGGSTTTKALIADADNLDILAEICLDTNGKPLETAQEVFREIREYIGDRINIKGIAYTGSSGAFYNRLFTDNTKNPELASTDMTVDEITCHARGVKHYNSQVDTIFECGGQDAKYTRFNADGTVSKAKMNLSCMAGTGQSMKNILDMVGLDFKTFEELALKAERTPITDETCAIFTEAGILKLVALGLPREEIAAAIAYGFMGGYANKFVGNETFGEYASAQGGPFKSKANLAALALHTETEVHAFPHRQLFGAFGAAISVYNEIEAMEAKGIEFRSKFKGLDIADMYFEKKTESCSDMLEENSCGKKDCSLGTYTLGEDTIFSGGACPKGNTDTVTKKAPNYTEIYKRLLDKELKKIGVKSIDDILDGDGKVIESGKPRIFIPRSLTFLNEKGVFYAKLYSSLGFDVVVSPESNDEIANLGITNSHTESCYPAKLANGHATFLSKYLREEKDGKAKDKLLLVNAISVGEEKRKFCPYVAASGFVAKGALNLSDDEVLLPVLHFDDPNYKIDDAIYKDIARAFGKEKFRKEDIASAVNIAEQEQNEFLDGIYTKGERFIEAIKKRGEKIFLGVGRGYTVLDNKANSNVHDLFASYGMHFIPAFFLRTPDVDLDKIALNMYWFQGQNMIKQEVGVTQDKDIYAVRLTNFNCGTDGMLLYHEGRIMDVAEMPFLILQTDGHNSNAQFGTRIQAHREVVKTHTPREVHIDELLIEKPEAKDLDNRTIGVPSMGDENANLLVAVLKSLGYKAEAIPSGTEAASHCAKKVLTTNNCQPFTFVTGETLSWINNMEELGYDPNKDLAILLPDAMGPCRFGQYSVIMRMFYDQAGFKELPVLSPSAQNDYADMPIPKKQIRLMTKTFYKSLIAYDILHNTLLRTRPYETKSGQTDHVYNALQERFLEIVEKGCNTKQLQRFMQEASDKFQSIPITDDERKPRVDMLGEIFVRCQPKSNQYSVRTLEENGLEVYTPSVAEWVDYINRNSIRKFWKDKRYGEMVKSIIKGAYGHHIRRKLVKPFENYLDGRIAHNPLELIDECQERLIYHQAIEGESPISIAEAYHFMTGNSNGDVPICGIYEVGPFGCMQETVAAAMIQSLIHKTRRSEDHPGKRVIPYMHAVFGDSESSNLHPEIAAFAKSCDARKKLTKS